MEYTVSAEDPPRWDVIGPAIGAYNERQAGPDDARTLCYLVRSENDEIVGGVIGATYWNWLSIDLMWVEESLRGQGYGSRLLELAEEEARRRGATNAFLDTFSFQAPDFYRRRGYEPFGELRDFPPGFNRFFLTKSL